MYYDRPEDETSIYPSEIITYLGSICDDFHRVGSCGKQKLLRKVELFSRLVFKLDRSSHLPGNTDTTPSDSGKRP